MMGDSMNAYLNTDVKFMFNTRERAVTVQSILHKYVSIM